MYCWSEQKKKTLATVSTLEYNVLLVLHKNGHCCCLSSSHQPSMFCPRNLGVETYPALEASLRVIEGLREVSWCSESCQREIWPRRYCWNVSVQGRCWLGAWHKRDASDSKGLWERLQVSAHSEGSLPDYMENVAESDVACCFRPAWTRSTWNFGTYTD